MNISYTDSIGWIGFLFIIVGYYLNAKKYINCFFIWGAGNIIYIIYGYILNAIPIIAMSAFVLCMNVYGYYSWMDKEWCFYLELSAMIFRNFFLTIKGTFTKEN